MAKTVDIGQLFEIIEEVSQDIILPKWRSLAAGDISEKKPGDYVTVADRQAEQALTLALAKLSPGAVIVGEEAAYSDESIIAGLASADVSFTIDPIDGTKNFVHGSDNFAVMICEVHRSVPVKSWIYQPVSKKKFAAELGAGTWCGDQKLFRGSLDRPAVGHASNWNQTGKITDFVDATAENTKTGGEAGQLVSLGEIKPCHMCAGVDYPAVCEGSSDFIVYQKKYTKPWDHLPGVLMVREAGGESLLAGGQRYGLQVTGNIFTACTPELAQYLCSNWSRI